MDLKLKPQSPPVLLLSDEGARDVLSLTPPEDFARPHERGVGGGRDFGVPEFDSRAWARLAISHPEIVKSFMNSPYDTASAAALKSVAAARRSLSRYMEGADAKPIENTGDWMTITEDMGWGALALLGMEDIPFLPRLRLSYTPSTGDYSVQMKLSPPCVDRMLDAFDDGAWALSSLNGDEQGLRAILSDETIVRKIFEGARVLYVPERAGFMAPRSVLVSRGRKRGRPVVQFWTPVAGQGSVNGSSTSLVVDQNSLERLTVRDIIKVLHHDARRALERGLQPAVALDLDGTLFNARKFTAQVFAEWLAGYDGPDAGEIRARWKELGLSMGWNSRAMLRQLGVTREETLEDANRHFDENFYSPARRMEMPVMRGPVELVRIMQSMGIKSVYVTLRSAADDSLPDGRSVAVELLKAAGIWRGDSFLLRHEGERIDWSEEAYGQGGNEPEKSQIVKRYRRENPQDYFIATVDNAPDHVLKYRDYFGYNIRNIHVRGDYPPNSPELPNGVYTVEPNQLFVELTQWRDAIVSSGRQLANEAISLAERIKHVSFSPHYWDDTERHERAIDDAAARLMGLIETFTQESWAQPFVQEFLGAVNARYGGEPGGLEFFEDVIGAVNHRAGGSFVALRGPDGLSGIVWSEGDGLPEYGKSAPLPARFNSSKVRLKRGVGVHDLASVLPGMVQGPDLESMGVRERYDLLSFGEYPRMAALFNSLVGMLCAEEGKRPEELTSVEYGPKMAIGGLIALARLGLRVGWREINRLKRIQTEQELRRLPDELRFMIRRVPDSENPEADVSVWNLPHIGKPLGEMAARTRNGGLVVTQTQMAPEDYEREHLGHRLLVDVPLGRGQYVLPSAFLHVPTQIGMPLSLQVWRVMK
ncbi:MAG: HAD family hydrolase [Proteobacteria bacterium]|nr:HAD family hydrolase [Pseudomonadota bacterium]